MAIQRKPATAKKSEAEAAAFVDGAPDARTETAAQAKPSTYEKGIPKGNKRQISLTISPDLLRKVDEVAKRSGQARAAVINMALYRALECDIFK